MNLPLCDNIFLLFVSLRIQMHFFFGFAGLFIYLYFFLKNFAGLVS